MNLKSVSDEHRIDPANARRWLAVAGGSWTIVVATCSEEARLLGLLWVANSEGKTKVDMSRYESHARPATEQDVERWLDMRRADVATARATG